MYSLDALKKAAENFFRTHQIPLGDAVIAHGLLTSMNGYDEKPVDPAELWRYQPQPVVDFMRKYGQTV